MRRREFIVGVGAAAMPIVAGAQQSDPIRRIAVLMGLSETDPYFRSAFAAFVQELTRFGWTEGSNARIKQRWTNGDIDLARAFARELVDLKPDVIFASTTPVTAALQRETRTIPIVFAVVADPVDAGIVAGLPHPGGNITGFANTGAASIGGKWLDLLKKIVPRMTRAAIMFNPDTAPGGGNYYLNSFEIAARTLAVEAVALRVRSDAEIKRTIASLDREQAGLVVMDDSYMAIHQAAVISAAALNYVPTMFGFTGGSILRDGALMAYGPRFTDMFRHAASYVDRILRGSAPADLPVQLPIEFDLGINIKTARALGLTVPNTLLVSADQVIEE